MTSGATDRLVVSATFTADLLNDVANFLAHDVGVPAGFTIAPYGQVFQQLLDPMSVLRQNNKSANVVCIRWIDLVQHASTETDYVNAAREIAAALTGFAHTVPCTVLICPQHDMAAFAQSATAHLETALRNVKNVQLIFASSVFDAYGVDQPYDQRGDKTGHIPYTAEAFAAIGTWLLRQYHAHSRTPLKMVAVDCDNTLWSGVVGEDGAEGIVIDDGAIALQARLAALAEAGVIIALLSKNQAADVDTVFSTRADMRLRPEHILDRTVNWQSKAENLSALAAKYAVGHDAIAFLDDNPIECAEMRSRLPAVQTIEIPKNRENLPSFVDNLWVLDHTATTHEDRKRIQMYQENVARNDSQNAAVSFADFLAGLELEIDIHCVNKDSIDRVSQLTQRTNQFNINLKRLSVDDLRHAPEEVYSVSVRDRFGDYGIVGAMSGHVDNSVYKVDLFLLSCRALGKGVEHKMLAHLGARALGFGCTELIVDYTEGPRNQPAKYFLEASFSRSVMSGQLPSTDPSVLADLTFEPTETALSMPVPKNVTSDKKNFADAYQFIADKLTTGAAIVGAFSAGRRARPELGIPFMAPSTNIERNLSAIWEEVLNVTPIGVGDDFQDLGGKSIHLVRIHSLMAERFGYALDLVTLFAVSTVKQLAVRIGDNVGGTTKVDARASDRAAKMKTARTHNRRRMSRRETA
ncbi:HAD-IIIC family phosphatase [Hyphococcus lacteus]|uniref:HAD-IIIC family phosphatase n=1 Tax=Hyphococcus lacteus TaxID=3143536 RepID=A0ABV3Z3P6_9PROT